MKYLATTNAILTVPGGAVVAVPTPDVRTTINGYPLVYSFSVTINVVGFIGVGTIIGTSRSVTSPNGYVCQGDKVSVIATNATTGATASYTVTVTSAGQLHVQGE